MPRPLVLGNGELLAGKVNFWSDNALWILHGTL